MPEPAVVQAAGPGGTLSMMTQSSLRTGLAENQSQIARRQHEKRKHVSALFQLHSRAWDRYLGHKCLAIVICRVLVFSY